MIRLSRRDWLGILLCSILTAVFLAIGVRYFERAFPEASIEFKVDRAASGAVARRFVEGRGGDLNGYRHSAEFTHDNEARIFLERKLGLEQANALMRDQVEVWGWRHRWFKPLQKEQFAVEISPDGELVEWAHFVADETPAPASDAVQARQIAEQFLLQQQLVTSTAEIRFLGVSEKTLARRTDRLVTFESTSVRPGGAPYRYELTLRGAGVASFRQTLRVPEEWRREYSALRSKNEAAGAVDSIFFVLTGVAAVVLFILRLRTGRIHIRFAVICGLIGFALTVLTSLNSFPSAIASFNTNESWQAFIGREILGAVLGGFASGVLVMILAGVGESFYRDRYPQHLAMPRLFQWKALRSRRVFFGSIIGFTLFAGFLAYQVVFYLVAAHYGAWSPAEVPYDEMVSTAFPWLAVLFMGFFPSVTEEFMSRAFSIPLFEKLFRSQTLAIIVAGFIWGFGHAAYPNQPFFIRGIEVGVAGVIIGFLMIRFGLLPLLIWHYTVDALYTSFLLIRSGNPYYAITAVAASLVFMLPLAASIVLYVRHGGFEDDDDLLNSASTVSTTVTEMPPEVAATPLVTAAPPIAVKAFPWTVAAALILLAGLAVSARRSVPADIDRYPMSKDEAISIARAHLASLSGSAIPSRVVAAPAGGFRTWNENSGAEEGGQPAGYDTVAAEYVLQRASVQKLLEIESAYVPAATWAVRFFEHEQRREVRVEVDPRNRRVIGAHEVLEENRPGGRLERAAAEKLAVQTLRRYGLEPRFFGTKEALLFEQPARRDWLFHFDEKVALAGSAHRRISVRVAGERVTQLTRTIEIPEHDRRAATQQTALNTVLLVAKLAGSLVALYVVLSGILSAAHSGRFAWRDAARITIFVAPLALAAAFVRFPTFLYGYDTSIAWATFLTTSSVQALLLLLVWLGGVWLAAAVALTSFRALRFVEPSGARRDAWVRVVAAVALLLTLAAVMTILMNTLHATWPMRSIEPSDQVGVALPLATSLSAIALQFFMYCAVAAAIACSPLSTRTRLLLTFAALFLLTIDTSISIHQLGSALIASALTAAVLTLLGFKLLAPSPRAVVVGALFLAAIPQLRELVGHGRFDLTVQGAILIVLIGLAGVLLAARLTPAAAET